MADLSITAASVLAPDAMTTTGRAAVAITAGQMVYRARETRLIGLADNNSATAEVRTPIGIALNGAAVGQPVAVATVGDVTLGAVLTAGVAYYLSDTPGGICPVADLGSGEYPCIVGMAVSASVLRLGVQTAGVAL